MPLFTGVRRKILQFESNKTVCTININSQINALEKTSISAALPLVGAHPAGLLCFNHKASSADKQCTSIPNFKKPQLQHLTISNLDAMCPCALNLTVIGFYNFAESLDTKFQQTEQSMAELSQLNHFQFRCWQPPWI